MEEYFLLNVQKGIGPTGTGPVHRYWKEFRLCVSICTEGSIKRTRTALSSGIGKVSLRCELKTFLRINSPRVP